MPDCCPASPPRSCRRGRGARRHARCITAFAAIACEIPDIRAEQTVAEGVVRVPVRPTVNGQLYTIVIEPRMTLLDAWREELGLTGTKRAFSVLTPVTIVPVSSRSLTLPMFLILHTCVIGAMSRVRPPVTLSRPAEKMRYVCDTTCRIAAKEQTVQQWPRSDASFVADGDQGGFHSISSL
jgi:hypothetical protein